MQYEVVEQKKNLSETDAGAYIDKTLIEQAKKHQEEMKALLEERDRAQNERMEIHYSLLICSPC